MWRFLPQVERERLEQEALRSASRSAVDVVQTVREMLSGCRRFLRALECSAPVDRCELFLSASELAQQHLLAPLLRGASRAAVNAVLEASHLISCAETATRALSRSALPAPAPLPRELNESLALALDAERPERALAALLAGLGPSERCAVAWTLATRSYWAARLAHQEAAARLHAGLRPRLIGTALAEAMRDPPSADELLRQADARSDLLQLEAVRVLRSLAILRGLPRPVRVGFVFAMYGEQANLRPGAPNNDLSASLAQLSGVSAVAPGLDWQLIGVCDGDDRGPSDPHRRVTSAEAARAMLEADWPGLLGTRVHVLEVEEATKARHRSIKGGAVLLGARHAIDRLGCELVCFNDLRPEFVYFVVGEALEPLLRDEADVVICSRWHPMTAAHRPPKRWVMSTVYTAIRSVMLPELSDLFDTQAAMKAFRAAALRDALPVRADGSWEERFDYSLSFDSHLLARLKSAGRRVVEAPTVLMGIDPGGSAVFAGDMARNLCRQRSWLDDGLARERRAVCLIAGGYDLHVFSRSDLPFVMKTPKFETGVGRLLMRFLEKAVGRLAGAQSPKMGLTHGLAAGELAVRLRDRLGELPPVILSKLFSAMRLAFSPYPVDLTGYGVAARRAGGLVPRFCVRNGLAVRVIEDREVETRLFPRLILQEKVDMQRTVARLLRRPRLDAPEVRRLIRTTLDLQHSLWRRGCYNEDTTYYLADTMIDSDGRAWYVDPGDFTDDLAVATDSASRELAGDLENRVDVQRLRAESPQWANIYLEELRSRFTLDALQAEWSREEPVSVECPDLAGLDGVLVDPTHSPDALSQLYQALTEDLVNRSSPWIGDTP